MNLREHFSEPKCHLLTIIHLIMLQLQHVACSIIYLLGYNSGTITELERKCKSLQTQVFQMEVCQMDLILLYMHVLIVIIIFHLVQCDSLYTILIFFFHNLSLLILMNKLLLLLS